VALSPVVPGYVVETSGINPSKGRLKLFLSLLHDGVLVNGLDLASPHQYLAVHDDGVDIVSVGEVCDLVNGHVQGVEVGLVEIDEDDVGLLALLKASYLIVQSERLGAVGTACTGTCV